MGTRRSFRMCLKGILYFYQSEGQILMSPSNVAHGIFENEAKYFDMPIKLLKLQTDEAIRSKSSFNEKLTEAVVKFNSKKNSQKDHHKKKKLTRGLTKSLSKIFLDKTSI